MTPCDPPTFDSPTELAEIATAGVQVNLAAGDTLAAAALQPVARAAWALAADPTAAGELLAAARAAQAALAMACGMTGERRFLRDVVAYAAAPASRVRHRRSGCS